MSDSEERAEDARREMAEARWRGIPCSGLPWRQCETFTKNKSGRCRICEIEMREAEIKHPLLTLAEKTEPC